MGLVQQLRSLSKETIIYGLGGAAGSLISLLLLPLYTKFLTPADYGYLTVFIVFQSIVEITAAFGLSSGLFRYYLMAKDEVEKETALSTCFWSQIVFIIFLGFILFVFSKQISVVLFGNISFSENLNIVSISGLFSALGTLIFSLMRADRKSSFFSVTQIIKTLLLAGFNIYMVAFLKWNYSGIIIGNFFAITLSTLIISIWFSKRIRWIFSVPLFRKIIFFVGPIFLVNLFFFLLNLSDRFFLNHFLSAKEVGVYSLGNKLGSIVMIGIISPFSIAIVPYAFSIAGTENFKETFAKIMKYFTLLLVGCSLIIFFFSKEIVSLISNSSYSGAAGIIGPVLLSSIFYGLYYSLSIALDIVEKTYLSTIVVVCGAAVSIVSNIIFIPYLGIYGSALAGCLANGTLFLLMYYFCQKNFHIRYETKSFIRLFFLIVIYIVCFFSIELQHNLFLSVIGKILLLISFPIGIYWIGVLDKKEKEFLRVFFIEGIVNRMKGPPRKT